MKEKRPTISPNFNFLGQLLDYEKRIKSQTGATGPKSKLKLLPLEKPSEPVIARPRGGHRPAAPGPPPGHQPCSLREGAGPRPAPPARPPDDVPWSRRSTAPPAPRQAGGQRPPEALLLAAGHQVGVLDARRARIPRGRPGALQARCLQPGRRQALPVLSGAGGVGADARRPARRPGGGPPPPAL